MKLLPVFILLMTIFLGSCNTSEQDINTISNENWKLEYDDRGVNAVISKDDPYEASVFNGRLDANVRFRMNDGVWQTVFNHREVEAGENMVRYTNYMPGMPFSLEQKFSFVDDALEWDLVIENSMYYNVEIGDIYVDIPLASRPGYEQLDLFERGYLRHLFISGDGSFMFFTKRSGNPPYLIVTVKPGTSLEYYDNDTYYIHSGYTGNNQQGTWRQEHTFNKLDPRGQGQDKLSFGFRMEWADSYSELRDIIYNNNLIDIRVVPGMSLPEDLEARFALHTQTKIDSIIPEYPEQTEISYEGEKEGNYHIYRTRFDRLGENMLTVYFDDGRKTYLEFFSTEPVETLLKKRTSFIVEKQQHRDPDLWYDGLFSIYDMKSSVLRGPDNTDGVFEGWYGYRVASDDPILGIPAFLASVNAVHPVDEQIDALEYHIENFVWGGLQRTEEETYPYGIHGVPNWKVARDTMLRAKIENRRLNIIKIWRTFDYPHMIMLYYHMFQIADRYPEKVSYLSADGYLELAWQTARAFFEYPYDIYPVYEIYKWGNYNEMLIPSLIEVLEERGRQEEADWLRLEWEKKAKYFIYDDPYPYASEFATDRTAFESSYALAKYGATTDMEPDEKLWYDKNEEIWRSHPDVSKDHALEFMERQLYASLSTRGWLENQYYRLGSDIRDDARLSYMSRMGGWAVLDYGIRFADNPYDWLQHGYASYLASFSLMNTGTAESDYGYWAPGTINDGALGQAFQPAKHENTWMGYEEDRGPWRYDSEQNLGMGAVTRMASTILANDPLFGWFAYGGKLEKSAGDFMVWPGDGVMIRFWLVDNDRRTGIELERDGFSKTEPIIINKERNRIELQIENITEDKHITRLFLDTEDAGQWQLSMDGKILQAKGKDKKAVFDLPVESSLHSVIIEKNK
ncbi:MAG: DUF5695 domain-containing protein [Bacteroidales bacterium]|nr:DUF5695 domain-containing protein [Bacteroidales bacterium]